MFKSLKRYTNTPILHDGHLLVARNGFRTHPIDRTGTLFKEGWEYAIEYGILGYNHYYGLHDNPPYRRRVPGSIPNLIIRTSVAERLQKVNEHLAKYNHELVLFNVWRPQRLEHFCRTKLTPRMLSERFPDWTRERICEAVARHWPDGLQTEFSIDPKSPPPHSTGAVVDLTIRVRGGDSLWMGTMFDDISSKVRLGALEPCSPSNVPYDFSFSDVEARQNRRLLHGVMTDVGFVGNPDKWWEYSWGDQAWACATSYQKKTLVPAYYSAINPLELI